jgi:serine/threonine protein kinase
MNLPPLKIYRESDFIVEGKNTLGSFSRIYICRERKTGRPVVLKYIKDDNKTRILNEIWHLWKCYKCKSKNIVKIYGLIKPYILVLEYCGQSLYDYITQNKLSLADRKNIGYKCVEAIKELHSYNILHLDIKLDNFAIIGDKIKLLDLGLSQNINYLKHYKCGTLGYSPPEVISDTPIISREADIWSAGVLLYELMTIKSPFDLGTHISREEVKYRINNCIVDWDKVECKYMLSIIKKMIVIDRHSRKF